MIGAIIAGEKINDFEKSTPFNLSWIIHGVAVKVAESHIVTIF